MADIKVYGTLVDETVNDKVAYANQVWHKTWQNEEGKEPGKDVAGILDDIEKKIENLPTPSEQNYKGRINIKDLISIPLDEIGDNDLYLVYSSGDEVTGWSDGKEFTLEGKVYPDGYKDSNGNLPEDLNVEHYSDGSFIQWIEGEWVAVDEGNIGISPIFDDLQQRIVLIESTHASTSYPDLYAAGFDGLEIAKVKCYKLDEVGKKYIPDETERGTPGQMYYGKNNRRTITVPYARFTPTAASEFNSGILTKNEYSIFKNSVKHFKIGERVTDSINGVRYSVTKDDEKGTGVYDPNYGYTSITVKMLTGFNIYEFGTLFTIFSDTLDLQVDPDYRNVRVKFDYESGSNTHWIPLMDSDGKILDGSKHLKKGVTSNTFQYRRDIVRVSGGSGLAAIYGVFHKILTDGKIKEIKLNGQTVEDEDGVINLEVDSTSVKSLKSREPMSSSEWTSAKNGSLGTTSTTDEFYNTIWEEIGHMDVSGDENISKSAVFSVRSNNNENLFNTLGCQFKLTKSGDTFTATEMNCTVDSPALENRFLLGYNNSAVRLYVRRDAADEQVFLFCNSSDVVLTQSSVNLWYKYSQLKGAGLHGLSKYNLSVVIGANEYRASEDGRFDLPIMPDNHLKSNFSINTGWSEVGYASYDDFYNFKKSLVFNISERSQISGTGTTDNMNNLSGTVTLNLFGTSNYSNYLFQAFECIVDNDKLVDKIRVVYNKNASDKNSNIKIYVKCDYQYQEWTLQDSIGNSPFKCTKHSGDTNDYLPDITKPSSGQLAKAVFKGGGSITEVQLNGKTIATSGVANVEAMPFSYFETSHNSGTSYTNKWREIAFFTMNNWTTGTPSFSQVFTVRDKISTTDKFCGILTFSARFNEGKVSHLFLNTDNPNLAGLFKAYYNNSTKRCSIYAKTIGGYGCWSLTTVSDNNKFQQGLDELVSEPADFSSDSAGKSYNATCYTSGGEGTITEVQLNGETIATSGIANIEAMPYKVFTTTKTGNAGTWQVIETSTIPVSSNIRETFIVKGSSTDTECRDGLLTLELTTNSSGTASAIRLYTDNPVLCKYFVFRYVNATSCYLYCANPYIWSLTCIGSTILSKTTANSGASSVSSATGSVKPICYTSSEDNGVVIKNDFDSPAIDEVPSTNLVHEKKSVCYTSDDTARNILGEDWRMPTKSEIDEIRSKCTIEIVDNYEGSGVSGAKVINKSDNSKFVFFPFAGEVLGTTVGLEGKAGYYLTSTYMDTTVSGMGGSGIFRWVIASDTNSTGNFYHRYPGFSIRPVSHTKGVDLGTGILWAESNLTDNGLAENPWDYGDHYAWGDLKSKSSYTKENSRWYDPITDRYTKYIVNGSGSSGAKSGLDTEVRSDVYYDSNCNIQKIVTIDGEEFASNSNYRTFHKFLYATGSAYSQGTYITLPIVNVNKLLRENYTGINYTIIQSSSSNYVYLPSYLIITDKADKLKYNKFTIEFDLADMFPLNTSTNELSWRWKSNDAANLFKLEDNHNDGTNGVHPLYVTNFDLEFTRGNALNPQLGNYPYSKQGGYTVGNYGLRGLNWSGGVSNELSSTVYKPTYNKDKERYECYSYDAKDVKDDYNSITIFLMKSNGEREIFHSRLYLPNGERVLATYYDNGRCFFERAIIEFNPEDYKKDNWTKTICHKYEDF